MIIRSDGCFFQDPETSERVRIHVLRNLYHMRLWSHAICTQLHVHLLMLPDERAPPLNSTETKQTLHVQALRLLSEVEPTCSGPLLSIQLDSHQMPSQCSPMHTPANMNASSTSKAIRTGRWSCSKQLRTSDRGALGRPLPEVSSSQPLEALPTAASRKASRNARDM